MEISQLQASEKLSVSFSRHEMEEQGEGADW